MSYKYEMMTTISTKEELTAIICDRCGKVITEDDSVEWEESVSVAFIGGYGSIFGDGVGFRCDLCQHCLKETLGEYIKPSEEW